IRSSRNLNHFLRAQVDLPNTGRVRVDVEFALQPTSSQGRPVRLSRDRAGIEDQLLGGKIKPQYVTRRVLCSINDDPVRGQAIKDAIAPRDLRVGSRNGIDVDDRIVWVLR